MVRTRNLFLAAATLSAIAASPHAARADSGAADTGKSEAIIGGSSSLARILAEQGAVPRPELIRPSAASMRRTVTIPAAGRAAPSVSRDRPDVFGTVALKVKRTSLDGKWRSVAQARVAGEAAAYAASLRKLAKRDRLETINRYVNGRVKFLDDSRQHGRGDLWATANQTLNRGVGDCEDYAIAKLQMLRESGFSDADLYLVILKDLVRRSDHAVVVVRLDDQMLVLDNGTDQVVESQSISDYRPIISFASNGSWTHGYRLASAPAEVKIASAATAARSRPVPAGSGY